MLRLEASSRVATARTAAQRAGSTQASAAFKDAQEKERFANARSAPEQTSDALTALRDAEARYREAEKEAIDARASMRSYLDSAKAQIGREDLIGAAGTLVKGLGTAPKNSALLGALQTVVETAETNANAAKRGADAVNASSRPQYAEANSRFLSAAKARATGRAEAAVAAVRDYTAAADLYREAAARAKEAPPSADSEAIRAAVMQMLAEYEAAYQSLDLQRVRRIRPAEEDFPGSLREAVLTISNVRVKAEDGRNATVNVTVQYRRTLIYGWGFADGQKRYRLRLAGPAEVRQVDYCRLDRSGQNPERSVPLNASATRCVALLPTARCQPAYDSGWRVIDNR